MLASTLASCPAALAGDAVVIDELKIGVLAHDVPDLWSGFSREDGVDINAEIDFSPAFTFLGGAVFPAAGFSVSTSGDTSKAYLDARIRWGGDTGFFLTTGVGAAIHDGETEFIDVNSKALGHRVLFHAPLELGWRFESGDSVSVYFEHVSNGNTADVNEGLDDIGVRYGRRF